MTEHHSQDLILIFNELFEHSEKTVLVGQGEEPLYIPADENFPLHRVIFKLDYFASALHEIAHWCIAGENRRQLIDYGYWYYPEGRNPQQQILFEQAEVKPQALEYLFSQAARSTFVASQDNLMMRGENNSKAFEKMIFKQAQWYSTKGLPRRAELFKNRLIDFYEEKSPC